MTYAATPGLVTVDGDALTKRDAVLAGTNAASTRGACVAGELIFGGAAAVAAVVSDAVAVVVEALVLVVVGADLGADRRATRIPGPSTVGVRVVGRLAEGVVWVLLAALVAGQQDWVRAVAEGAVIGVLRAVLALLEEGREVFAVYTTNWVERIRAAIYVAAWIAWILLAVPVGVGRATREGKKRSDRRKQEERISGFVHQPLQHGSGVAIGKNDAYIWLVKYSPFLLCSRPLFQIIR